MIEINPKVPFNTEWCAYWENFLTEEEINFLIHHSSWNTKTSAKIGGGNEQAYDSDYRRTNVAWFDFSPEHQTIWNKIKEVIATVNNQYFHADVKGIYEPMQLTEYTAADKGYYDWHTDMAPEDKLVPRKLSMVLMLSDPSEYEGGFFQIKTAKNNTTLEMKKGRAWFFPSYVLHRVTPITKGLRKTAVVWAGGEHWK